MAPVSVEQWVDQRQMAGRYTFLRREAVAETGRSAEDDCPGDVTIGQPALVA